MLLLGTLFGLFILSLTILRVMDAKREAQILDEATLEKEANVERILELKNLPLQTLSRDYSLWGEMVDFVKTRSPEWAAVNINNGVSTYGANAAWVFDPEFSQIYDYNEWDDESIKKAPFPAENFKTAFKNEVFFHFFVESPRGLLEVRGAAIQPSDDDKRVTPPRGYFFVAHAWNEEYLQEISDLTDCKVTSTSPASPSPASPSPQTTATRHNLIVFSQELPGWDQKPVAIVTFYGVSGASETLGRMGAHEYVLFFFLMLAVLITTAVLVTYWVNAPLRAISSALKKGDQDPMIALQDSGDEFGEIAALILDFFVQRRELRDNEEKYHHLFNSASDAIFLMKHDLFIDCNARALEIFGCTREQIVGQPPYRFSPVTQPDGRRSREKAREKIDAALRGEPQSFEWVHARFDGTPFLAEVSLNTVTINKEVFVQALVRDVSKRKEMEQSVKESEQKFKAIFDSTKDGILIVDARTHVFSMGNKKISEMLGYPPEELTKLKINDIHPRESLSSVLDTFERQSRGEFVVAVNTPVLRKDGSVFFADISSSKILMSGKEYLIGSFRDATERKKAEEALQNALAFTHEVISGAGEGVIVYDRGFRIREWNPFMEDMTGVPRRDVIGQCTFELFPHLKEQGIDKLLTRALLGETVSSPDTRFYIPATGKSGWVRGIYTPHRDKNGAITGVIALVRDITGSRKAEETLRTSQAQLSNAASIARLGPWEYDVAGDTFTFNDAFYAVYRTTAEQAGGYQMSSAEYAKRFVHPDDAAIVAEETRKAVETDDPQYNRRLEHRIIYADGETGYVTVRFFAVKDDRGRTVRTFGVNQDITERRKVEETLRENEERLRDIIFSMADWMWETDERGVYTYSSIRGSDILHRPPEEILGKTPFDFMPPDEAKKVAALFSEIAVRKEPIRELENWNIDGNGKLICLVTSGVPILDNEGNLKGYRGVDKDITGRKNAEKELREAYEKLKETHAQLVQSTKMASVGLLAGGVAHEINNPLTGVLNNVQLIALMAQQKKDFSLEDFKDILKDIEDSALRCVSITQSLLNFSRASKGVFEPISLNVAVKDILPLVENELKLSNIAIGTQLNSDLPQISGDIQLIEQVIFDMINNARWAILESSGEKGGVITLKTDAEPDGRHVSVSISDTGIGIAKENLEKIFDPFFTTKEPGEGTGLGLSIGYNIVQSHQGTITVTSEPGVGTTFKLVFLAL